ncbi:protocadherin-15, partial [Biomphalaria glabrata]
MNNSTLPYSDTKTFSDGNSVDYLNWKLLSFMLVTVPCTLIGFFDLVSNFLNVCVFAAQGMKSSVEVTFFAIALTDLVRSFIVQFENLCINSYADDIDLPVVMLELFYVVVNWPLGCAIRASLHYTVYITIERCLCIMFPLTIKTIVTKKTTIFVIACIVVLNLLTLYPFYSTVYLAWSYRPKQNKTLLGIGFLKDKSEPLKITYLLHIVLVVGGLGLLVIFTGTLVTQMHYRQKWRMQNSSGFQKHKNLVSSRDRKSARLVIVIAILFVVCYLPMVVSTLASYFIPDYSFNGKYDTAIRGKARVGSMERLVLTGALALLWTSVACQNACNSTSTIVIAFPELDPPNKPSETDPVYTKAILTNGRPFNVSFTFSPDDKRKKFPFDDYFRHNFSASTNSYVVSMKQGIDRDGKTSSPFDDTDFINYTMYCQAVDGGTVEEKKLAIQLLDVNDNAPLFSFGSYGVFLNEFAPVGVTVLRGIVADDLDAGLNREITYRLTPVALGVPSVYNGTDYFYLPPEKGDEVTLIQSAVLPTLSLTSQFDFYFLVTAQDRAVPASSQRSSKTSVYVSVFNGSEPSIGVYYPSCIQPVVPSPKKCILPRYYTSVTFGDTSEIKLELYPEPPDPNNTGTPVDIMFQDESLINGSQIPIVSILETLPSNYDKFFTVSVIQVGTNNFKCELRKVAGKALNSTSFKTLQISLEIDEDPLLPEWVTIYVMVKGPYAPVLLSNSTDCYIYENATLGSKAISDKSNGGLYKLMFSDPNKYSSSPGIFDVTVLPGTPFTVDNNGFVSLANGALDYESQQIYNVT